MTVLSHLYCRGILRRRALQLYVELITQANVGDWRTTPCFTDALLHYDPKFFYDRMHNFIQLFVKGVHYFWITRQTVLILLLLFFSVGGST